MLKKIIAVAGPTASGKTALAVEIAKRVGGEVVSCDSMQIYKGMDIGTAKPDMEEMCGIPHHMIDIISPDQRYSVADFADHARRCIEDILLRGKVPVLAGGTGLYMDSVLNNTEFVELKGDPEFCREMMELSSAEGKEAVHKKLQQIDPEAAENIHPNNLRRVIRALEVCKITGKTFTRVNLESRREAVYDALIFGIETDRSVLYERINLRVDKMIEKGLVSEVKSLWEKGIGQDSTAIQAIGYKELIDFLEGKCSFDEAVEKIKMESRRYAKRQLTWFKRNDQIQWIRLDSRDDTDKIIDRCLMFLD